MEQHNVLYITVTARVRKNYFLVIAEQMQPACGLQLMTEDSHNFSTVILEYYSASETQEEKN